MSAGEFRVRARARGADAAGAALLGDAAAILAGDLLLHEASRLIAPRRRARRQCASGLFGLLDDAIYVSAAGELADVENAVMPDYAEAEAIFDATFNKTAVYSFSAPLCAGALLARRIRRGDRRARRARAAASDWRSSSSTT